MNLKKRPLELSAFALHLLAMAFMLGDHMWATVIPGNDWLNWVGRLAFPIFAFLIAEGYHHTSDFRRYRRRMFLFALLAEIPFNLMCAASWFYPLHQNVLWTFLIALQAMRCLDRIREKHRDWKALPLCALALLGFYLLGTILLMDYAGCGVLMVLVFYLFRGNGWLPRLGQLVCLCWINWALLRGQLVILPLPGRTWEIPVQGFGVFSLLFIWCYRGRQGPHSRWLQLGFYAFYPAHMLILGLLRIL